MHTIQQSNYISDLYRILEARVNSKELKFINGSQDLATACMTGSVTGPIAVS